MNPNLEGYNCKEYLDEYYSFGLFHGTECQIIYSHDKIVIDEDKKFLRVGEVYDDHDLILGYRKNENGIWGHYNRHFDGTFQFVSDTLKQFCEGLYQKTDDYWHAMETETQWAEISKFYDLNIDIYSWKAEPITKFINQCIDRKLLTNLYIKAYKTLIGITKDNGFSTRSFTNMVYVKYEHDQEKYLVIFKTNFFDYDAKSKEYKFERIDEAINDINEWIIKSV